MSSSNFYRKSAQDDKEYCMFCDSRSCIEWCQRKCSNHNCYLIKDEDIVELKGLNEENDKITEQIAILETIGNIC